MELLVSTDWLANEIGASDLRVVDATWFMPDAGRSAQAEYEGGHIVCYPRMVDADIVRGA